MHQPTRPASPYRLEKSCLHFRGTSHELCSRLPSARLLPSFLIKCDIQDLFCLCEQNFPLSPSPSISLCYPWPSSCILHPLQNQTKPQVTRAQEPVWPWVLMSQIWLICYIGFFPINKKLCFTFIQKNIKTIIKKQDRTCKFHCPLEHLPSFSACSARPWHTCFPVDLLSRLSLAPEAWQSDTWHQAVTWHTKMNHPLPMRSSFNFNEGNWRHFPVECAACPWSSPWLAVLLASSWE